jgi:broad specificity phosphatase PhoE
MSLYYVRHGETDWNERMLIQGRIEVPLNEKGRDDARKTASLLKDIGFKAIYCSPLRRALETAEIINESHRAPVIVKEELAEMYYGDMEGAPRKGPVYEGHRGSFAARYPNGEGYLDVAARIFPLLDKLKAEHHDDDILIVAHGGISRVVEAYFRDMANDEFVHHACPNGSVARYEWDESPRPFRIKDRAV